MASVSGGQECCSAPCRAQESHPLSCRKSIQPPVFIVPRLRTLIHRPAWVRRISFSEVFSCGRRGCLCPHNLAAGFPQSELRERARRQPHCLLGPIFLEAIHRIPPTLKGRQVSSRSRGKSTTNLWTPFKTNTPTYNRSFHVKVEMARDPCVKYPEAPSSSSNRWALTTCDQEICRDR